VGVLFGRERENLTTKRKARFLARKRELMKGQNGNSSAN